MWEGAFRMFKTHEANIMYKREFNPLRSEYFWPSFFDSFPKSSHDHPWRAHKLHTKNEILLLVPFQCMEQCLNVMSFVNNIIFNQAVKCVIGLMKLQRKLMKTMQPVQSAGNQQKRHLLATDRLQRRKQQTEERWEEQTHLIKAAAQQLEEEINEQAKKDKKSSSSGAPAERRPWSMCSQKRAREAELGREERMMQRTDKRSKSGSTEGKLEIIGKVKKIQETNGRRRWSRSHPHTSLIHCKNEMKFNVFTLL